MKRILIPVDCSEFSERAVVQGKKMAKAFGSEVVLMYVVAIRPINPRFGMDVSSKRIEDSETVCEGATAKEMMEKYKESFGEMKDKVEIVIAHGIIADEIIDVINSNDYDLVIMGSHGIGSALYRTFLGSVTNKVIHNSTKPMMIIR